MTETAYPLTPADFLKQCIAASTAMASLRKASDARTENIYVGILDEALKHISASVVLAPEYERHSVYERIAKEPSVKKAAAVAEMFVNYQKTERENAARKAHKAASDSHHRAQGRIARRYGIEQARGGGRA